MDYEAALARLNGRTSRRMPGRATYMQLRPDESIAIRYHSTDVVVWRMDGGVVLNSGGYRTVTTKERMNSYSGIGVDQERGQWFANDVKFTDGMAFKDGVVQAERSN